MKLVMRRGSTGAIMPSASMSSATVKKMKVAAARRPVGAAAMSCSGNSGAARVGFGLSACGGGTVSAESGWGGVAMIG